MKTRLYIDVEFNDRKTDSEGIATAFDNVVKTGMAALGDCWDEYGGKPKIGQFLVLDTERAVQHANSLDGLIDNQNDELGQMLVPIRDFLGGLAK
jgi:hypothetical protein